MLPFSYIHKYQRYMWSLTCVYVYFFDLKKVHVYVVFDPQKSTFGCSFFIYCCSVEKILKNLSPLWWRYWRWQPWLAGHSLHTTRSRLEIDMVWYGNPVPFLGVWTSSTEWCVSTESANTRNMQEDSTFCIITIQALGKFEMGSVTGVLIALLLCYLGSKTDALIVGMRKFSTITMSTVDFILISCTPLRFHNLNLPY